MIIEKKKYGFLDMVLIPFKVSPMYSIIFAIKYIADALMPTLSIFATASFINNAIMVYNGETSLSSVYLSIASNRWDYDIQHTDKLSYEFCGLQTEHIFSQETCPRNA